MKKIIITSMLVITLSVTACNTINGMGKDISGASTTVQNAMR